ncbi:MAG: hypothetical protein NZ954_00370 [Thermofilaceae archaeon]|nr:hypothetical protein [Thermofilaceae archaeon]MCX8180366.1 hypothetical protein [Thermofilaceae archaeon]MDW8003901.1 hypothetical protein [Thermofilaceae archaeon]
MVRGLSSPTVESVEKVLKLKASASKSAIFSVRLVELLNATGLNPSYLPRLFHLVFEACEDNGYKLLCVYAKIKGNKAFWNSLNENIPVYPHSRCLLLFSKNSSSETKRIIQRPW